MSHAFSPRPRPLIGSMPSPAKPVQLATALLFGLAAAQAQPVGKNCKCLTT